MPLKHRAPSSAKPTGEHRLFSFNNLSNGSKARFQILLLKIPPCGVPQTGLIVLMIPRTSAIKFLFFKEVHIPPNHYRGIIVVHKDIMDCFGCQIIKGTHDIYK